MSPGISNVPAGRSKSPVPSDGSDGSVDSLAGSTERARFSKPVAMTVTRM